MLHNEMVDEYLPETVRAALIRGQSLLDIHNPGKERTLHCRAVARLAVAMALALSDAGAGIDVELVAESAVVHDIAKGKPNHAASGAALLRSLGRSDLAHIVADHVDFTSFTGPITEAEIVCLADKLVASDEYVGLEKRFSQKLARFGDTPEAREAVAGRRDRAEIALSRFENAAAMRIDSLVTRTAIHGDRFHEFVLVSTR
ncbi:HD domain-containing protein [Desulfovibrio inopinatus]|uniref:HD domain-containing protein n=1 Tax=Desulfovibrio inopinatus TaxID=102109 RepID=UPI000421D25C|nr:HD domain-containing protein [Desulfovibrio inopinatus]